MLLRTSVELELTEGVLRPQHHERICWQIPPIHENVSFATGYEPKFNLSCQLWFG